MFERGRSVQSEAFVVPPGTFPDFSEEGTLTPPPLPPKAPLLFWCTVVYWLARNGVSPVCLSFPERQHTVCIDPLLRYGSLAPVRQVRAVIDEMQKAISNEYGVTFEDGVQDRLCAYAR